MGTKLKLKVGDKVKIIDYPSRSMIGEIGLVVDVYLPDSKFLCRVNVGTCWSCPMLEKEIELSIKIGEQLMLFEL